MAASDDADPQPQAIAIAVPAPLSLPPSVEAKKTPGTWTPLETMHLIDAYREKWYALKRGQLRTRHWEEVAESLATRCAGHPDANDKSSVQCRHKLEKLRRRYRSERQICLREGPGASQWPFFDRMDRMERGPGSGGVRAALPFPDLDYQKRFAGSGREFPERDSPEDDAEDSDQPPPKVFPSRKRSRHHHDQPRASFDDNEGSYTSLNRKHGLYDPPQPKSSEYRNLRTSAEKPSGSHAKNSDSAPLSELASLIGSLGEAFLRMEQMKIQMQRDTERFRADMELRRTELVLDCQKQIADMFTKALCSNKRSKKAPSSEE